jgi:hypothetical protein
MDKLFPQEPAGANEQVDALMVDAPDAMYVLRRHQQKAGGRRVLCATVWHRVTELRRERWLAYLAPPFAQQVRGRTD